MVYEQKSKKNVSLSFYFLCLPLDFSFFFQFKISNISLSCIFQIYVWLKGGFSLILQKIDICSSESRGVSNQLQKQQCISELGAVLVLSHSLPCSLPCGCFFATFSHATVVCKGICAGDYIRMHPCQVHSLSLFFLVITPRVLGLCTYFVLQIMRSDAYTLCLTREWKNRVAK